MTEQNQFHPYLLIATENNAVKAKFLARLLVHELDYVEIFSRTTVNKTTHKILNFN